MGMDKLIGEEICGTSRARMFVCPEVDPCDVVVVGARV
jgi:hypothetical protein